MRGLVALDRNWNNKGECSCSGRAQWLGVAPKVPSGLLGRDVAFKGQDEVD